MGTSALINQLSNEVNPKRMLHSIKVMEVAEKMAIHYHVDVEKAKIAAILHDCGKNYKGQEALEYVKEIPYEPDPIEKLQPKLLHGIIGQHLAKTKYNINDNEILDAIRWHTTGRAGMSNLEKIIYIADYIEPLRTFKGIEEMRRLAFIDLDECIIHCAESSINYVLKKGVLLHHKTVETRNYSLTLINKNIT